MGLMVYLNILKTFYDTCVLNYFILEDNNIWTFHTNNRGVRATVELLPMLLHRETSTTQNPLFKGLKVLYTPSCNDTTLTFSLRGWGYVHAIPRVDGHILKYIYPSSIPEPRRSPYLFGGRCSVWGKRAKQLIGMADVVS